MPARNPHRREWRLRLHGSNWLVVRAGDLRDDEEALPYREWLSHDLSHAAHDSISRHTLVDLYREVSGGWDQPQDVNHQVSRLVEAFRRRSLVLVRQRTAGHDSGTAGATPPPVAPADEPAPAGPKKPKKEKTWVALRLVDQDNVPVSGEKYHIVLPDGSARDGSTDSAGEGWVEDIDPGNCQFSFPDLDASEWTAV